MTVMVRDLGLLLGGIIGEQPIRAGWPAPHDPEETEVAERRRGTRPNAGLLRHPVELWNLVLTLGAEHG